MAGTPIKRARKEAEARAREAAGLGPGLVVVPAPPVAGGRGAGARPPPPRPPLPPDSEQATLARRVLLDIAVNGGGPDAGARVGAAKALLEVSTAGESALVAPQGSPERALGWLRDILPRLEVLVAERAVCAADGSRRQHRSATEVLAAIRAALPKLEARAAAEAESAASAPHDGQWRTRSHERDRRLVICARA
jgi:hypothetical protein